MKKKYLIDPNFVPAKKSKKKIIYSTIYYVVGALVSLLFIPVIFAKT